MLIIRGFRLETYRYMVFNNYTFLCTNYLLATSPIAYDVVLA
jgi:hypothetical protein